MKKITLILSFLVFSHYSGTGQQVTVQSYAKNTYMIPMRDSVKLFTVVFTPVNIAVPFPLLIQRTPYGADKSKGYSPLEDPFIAAMAKEGYIFVFQDIRGRFKSEGKFEMNRPLYHISDKRLTDESTDAYDAIDWLIRHIPRNNGKAGILGISYLGYTALDVISDPHPALMASSPQASPADMFLGDDFHHNGAFRLSYGFEYSYFVENEKEGNSLFPFPQYDVYEWYLNLGSLQNVNDKYYHNRLNAWNNFVQHPNYDNFWKSQSMLTQIRNTKIPVLHVGGYYDEEDLNGPQIMYLHLEKVDSFSRNYIVLGPWNHGGWAGPNGDSLGKIDFESKTSQYFQNLQKKWFDYWLKGIVESNFSEATCFQTGTNKWKTYTTWPPKDAELKYLYPHSDGTCSFDRPATRNGAVSYLSDPDKPVPYRLFPIEATYGIESRWYTWQVEDQRFVTYRPDVISFTTDSLKDNLTITGDIKAHLIISTTGTDADFVVKLIDVYPNYYDKNVLLSGYQFPVTMEVYRGRFRKSFEKPEPFVPNKPEEIVIDLHQINHAFLRGHKLMIQIQSTWFPLIDRNPQKFIPNIFEANDSDFIKATQTIYCNNKLATYIELPVLKQQ